MRRFLQICGFALLGVVTSLAVAAAQVALVATTPPRGTPTDLIIEASRPAAEIAFEQRSLDDEIPELRWRVVELPGDTCEKLHADGWQPQLSQDPRYNHHLSAQTTIRFGVRCRVVEESEGHCLLITRVASEERAAGWPLPCLSGRRVADNTRFSLPPPTARAWFYLSAIDATRLTGNGALWMPSRPAPLPLIADSAFFTLLIASLWLAPRSCRRALRILHHRCTSCGYRLRVSPLCSECGHVNRRSPSLRPARPLIQGVEVPDSNV